MVDEIAPMIVLCSIIEDLERAEFRIVYADGKNVSMFRPKDRDLTKRSVVRDVPADVLLIEFGIPDYGIYYFDVTPEEEKELEAKYATVTTLTEKMRNGYSKGPTLPREPL